MPLCCPISIDKVICLGKGLQKENGKRGGYVRWQMDGDTAREMIGLLEEEVGAGVGCRREGSADGEDGGGFCETRQSLEKWASHRGHHWGKKM